MRGWLHDLIHPASIRHRMQGLIIAFTALAAVVLVTALSLLLRYNSSYQDLLDNVTTASEFNQDFKENIDLKMYYYVIESQYSEGLPIQEVQAAQALAKNLLSATSQKDSLRAITSVLDLCENLEEKIYQIEETQSYDDRQSQLENNIYVLTALIEKYMYNYLYYESAQLNRIQQQVSRRLAAEILLVLVLSAVLTLLLIRYSVRLARSVTQPVVELSRRAEDVTGGDLTRRQDGEVEAEGIRRRRSRARALLSCEMCAAAQEGVEGEGRDRERERGLERGKAREKEREREEERRGEDKEKGKRREK